MNKIKTRQAISKRFKMTKNGKVLHRTCGQDHFNSRDTGAKTQQKRNDRVLSTSNNKTIKLGLGL